MESSRYDLRPRAPKPLCGRNLVYHGSVLDLLGFPRPSCLLFGVLRVRVETSFSLGGIGLVPPVAWGLPPLALA